MNTRTLPPLPLTIDSGERASAPLLFVPVDATEASRRVLDRAIELAQLRSARIILVGLLREPAEDGMDVEEVTALLTAAEYGYGIAVPRFAEDEEARLTRLVRLVLVPYQQRVQAAGVPAQMRVVRAACAEEQVREILGEMSLAPSRAEPLPELILGDPTRLEGPLQALTLDLLAAPPCAEFVAAFHRGPAAKHAGMFARLAALLLRPFASLPHEEPLDTSNQPKG